MSHCFSFVMHVSAPEAGGLILRGNYLLSLIGAASGADCVITLSRALMMKHRQNCAIALRQTGTLFSAVYLLELKY